MRLRCFCIICTICLFFVSCEDEKVDRLESLSLSDVTEKIVFGIYEEVDELMLSCDYEHTQAAPPFTMGYVQGDTNFVYLLVDSVTHLVAALQLRYLRTSVRSCMQAYSALTAANRLIMWHTWQGSVKVNDTQNTFTSYTDFISDALAVFMQSDVNAFQISEKGESDLLRFQLSASPLPNTALAVVYVLNIKN